LGRLSGLGDVTRFSGSLTEDEYGEVCRLTRRLYPSVAARGQASLWWGTAFLALGAWGYLLAPSQNVESLSWWYLAAPCFLWWWWRRPDPRKDWQRTPELRGPYEGTVLDDVLEITLGGVPCRVPWHFFGTRASSERVLVLSPGPHLVLPLAKSFFEDAAAWDTAAARAARVSPRRTQTERAWLKRVILWAVALLLILLAWHFAMIKRSDRRPNERMQQTRSASTSIAAALAADPRCSPNASEPVTGDRLRPERTR
jgi:hypothetical protein